MSAEQFGNPPKPSRPFQPWTELAAHYVAGSTVLHVIDSTPFPQLAQFTVRINDEYFLVTGGAGTKTWTVVPGQENTVRSNHTAGAGIFLERTAATMTRALGGGGGSPGGLDTYVQFNNAGAFGGDAGFTYVSPGEVTLTGASPNLSFVTGDAPGGETIIGFRHLFGGTAVDWQIQSNDAGDDLFAWTLFEGVNDTYKIQVNKGTAGELLLNQSGGNVGIGVAPGATTANLHVGGTVLGTNHAAFGKNAIIDDLHFIYPSFYVGEVVLDVEEQFVDFPNGVGYVIVGVSSYLQVAPSVDTDVGITGFDNETSITGPHNVTGSILGANGIVNHGGTGSLGSEGLVVGVFGAVYKDSTGVINGGNLVPASGVHGEIQNFDTGSIVYGDALTAGAAVGAYGNWNGVHVLPPNGVVTTTVAARGLYIEDLSAFGGAGVVQAINYADKFIVGKIGNLEMGEVTAPSAPADDFVRIYAEDNGSGKTRLMALFATGSAIQLAVQA